MIPRRAGDDRERRRGAGFLRFTRSICAMLAALVLACSGCGLARSTHDHTANQAGGSVNPFSPSNHRQWNPPCALVPEARFKGSEVRIENVRNFRYLSEDDYVINYDERTYDLNQIKSVDFVVVPFKDAPSLAHTMLSFGFEDERYLAISVEARLEENESYSPLAGALKQYELMYVVADERDVIPLRTTHRQADVYLYPGKATPDQTRRLFVDMLQRANKLAKEPEFYDTFSNNCTTNLVRHINQLVPGRVPYDLRILLPGYSDQLAYELGLIDKSLPFEEARRRARINEWADQYAAAPDFSQRIRR